MDAHLGTLSTELYQVNIRIGRIARRQATMGGFAPEATPSPPPPMAFDSKDKDANDGDDDDEMEMLALPMRCLLDTLILCHS